MFLFTLISIYLYKEIYTYHTNTKTHKIPFLNIHVTWWWNDLCKLHQNSWASFFRQNTPKTQLLVLTKHTTSYHHITSLCTFCFLTVSPLQFWNIGVHCVVLLLRFSFVSRFRGKVKIIKYKQLFSAEISVNFHPFMISSTKLSKQLHCQWISMH